MEPRHSRRRWRGHSVFPFICLFRRRPRFSIDVRDWSRQGLLCDGWEFPWLCSASQLYTEMDLTVRVETDAAALSISSRNHGEMRWKHLEQYLPIERTACHLGGSRAWFRCNAYLDGKPCGRRIAVVYSTGDLFACRHCHGLTYNSRQENPKSRSISQSRKIRMRLGGSPNLFKPFPAKPTPNAFANVPSPSLPAVRPLTRPHLPTCDFSSNVPCRRLFDCGRVTILPLGLNQSEIKALRVERLRVIHGAQTVRRKCEKDGRLDLTTPRSA